MVSSRNRMCEGLRAESGLCLTGPAAQPGSPTTLQGMEASAPPTTLPRGCQGVRAGTAHALGESTGSETAQPGRCFSWSLGFLSCDIRSQAPPQELFEQR